MEMMNCEVRANANGRSQQFRRRDRILAISWDGHLCKRSSFGEHLLNQVKESSVIKQHLRQHLLENVHPDSQIGERLHHVSVNALNALTKGAWDRSPFPGFAKECVPKAWHTLACFQVSWKDLSKCSIVPRSTRDLSPPCMMSGSVCFTYVIIRP